MWTDKFHHWRKEISTTYVSCVVASITPTYGKPPPGPARGEGKAIGETKQLWCKGVADARGQMFPQEREQNHQGYPSTISIPSVERWETSDLDCWPERIEPEVIAASDKAWRHNL